MNARGHWGFTPLIDAAENAMMDVLRVLLTSGADVLAKDDEVRICRGRCTPQASQGETNAAFAICLKNRKKSFVGVRRVLRKR